MENDQNQSSFEQPSSSNISFPSVAQPRKSGGQKTLLIIGILILVGILGFVIFKTATKKDEVALDEPTPFDNLTTASEDTTSQTPTPTPSASPSATVKPADKSVISIEIQNGTGVPGEAAYLQTQLKNLGYSDIKVGNASSTDATATIVTFGKDVASTIVTEITKKLESIYTTVTTKTATSGSNIVIVTGLRKGATAKPSASPSASPSATPKATATP
ncbi:MAG TPA: LytR C-terminal domain-containing protein [Alphaproteobacteria bacterium]|jgi:hypothetical protein|nr:LytR C-terminal domain-containing protein [Alphaproteobacteria bacterium]